MSSKPRNRASMDAEAVARMIRAPSDLRDGPVRARPVEPRGDAVSGRPRAASRT